MPSTNRPGPRNVCAFVVAHGAAEITDRKTVDDFVASRLSFGELGEAVGKESALLKSARWYSLAENDQAKSNFNAGGIYKAAPSTRTSVEALLSDDERLAEIVTRYLADSDTFCVMENPVARPTDPFVAKLRSQIRYRGSTVLHWLAMGSPFETVLLTLGEAKHSPYCFGIAGKDHAVLEDGARSSHVSHEMIDRLVSGIEMIFFAAYDGESYVIGVVR